MTPLAERFENVRNNHPHSFSQFAFNRILESGISAAKYLTPAEMDELGKRYFVALGCYADWELYGVDKKREEVVRLAAHDQFLADLRQRGVKISCLPKHERKFLKWHSFFPPIETAKIECRYRILPEDLSRLRSTMDLGPLNHKTGWSKQGRVVVGEPVCYSTNCFNGQKYGLWPESQTARMRMTDRMLRNVVRREIIRRVTSGEAEFDRRFLRRVLTPGQFRDLEALPLMQDLEAIKPKSGQPERIPWAVEGF